MRAFLSLPLLIAAGLAASRTDQSRAAADASWTSVFPIEPGELASTGRNPYFVLEPGYQLTLESGDERLVVTVLDEVRNVADVDTRVVEERETRRGKLVEISRNFFAISRLTNSVFYFGEEVDTYQNDTITGHEGAWMAGKGDARVGLMMPGLVLLRARYYQEIAPRVAMDRAEITSLNAAVSTPAGTFTNCLEIQETTPLEPGARESKFYVRGIGLVQDGSLKLVGYGRPEAR